MRSQDIIQIVVFFGLLISLTPVLGTYMYTVLSGKISLMVSCFGWFERFFYKVINVNPDKETDWKGYSKSLLMFSLVSFIFLYIIQIGQFYLPLNPTHFPNVKWHTAFNTSISFVTNTNWQGYAGETTLSYFVQMLGLTVQNFVSAAVGIAVLLALIRGLTRKTTDKVGNFWVDITRTILYILLPLSMVMAVLLAGQGVIQNFRQYITIDVLQGGHQVLPMGPVASQVAIKQLGTNGGGFFNANSAHPFENPTPFSNFIEMLAILLIPASLTYTYGRMVGSTKQGWIIFTAMIVLFSAGIIASLVAENSSASVSGCSSLMEGKETRFGVANSILWSASTTAASNGSVNAMLDSLSPISGLVAMINIMLGEVVFGGVGAGLYGMIIFIILTVFIAGLMVGRTPEYLGKKIEAFEVQMAIIAVLAPSFVILVFSAVASAIDSGLSGLTNHGPHGLSEILYAFASAAGNNGSSFAGLNAGTPFYNITLGIGMIIGRFGVILPVMAIAGSLAGKKITPPSTGTFRTDNWLFVVLLVAVIVIIGGLTFFPAMSLGPIVEHLLMRHGVAF